MASTDILPETTAKLNEAKDHAGAEAASAAVSEGSVEAKARFGKAVDEARAGAAALGEEALNRADTVRAHVVDRSADLIDDARARASQAAERLTALATDGKTKASDAIGSLGKYVSDSADTVDEKLGNRAGDFARTAAASIQDAAAQLDAKDFADLGDDVKAFVRANPVAALGIAAFVGYVLARLFRGKAPAKPVPADQA